MNFLRLLLVKSTFFSYKQLQKSIEIASMSQKHNIQIMQYLFNE